jgi:trehalose 6-phosphate phosphatase
MSSASHDAGMAQPPESVDLGRTALLLDVDGTLLELAPTPGEVVVPVTLRGVLGELSERADGAVALVSGRRIASLDELFFPLILPAIGGHGAEMRTGSGAAIVETTDAMLGKSLRRELLLLAEVDPRILVEDKVHSVALHYRLAPECETLLKVAAREIIASEPGSGVELVAGDHVIDVKPRAFNKGLAVRRLMGHAPFKGRTPLFIGDDTTDESVFARLPALRGRGFSVGRTMSGADGMFASPEEVRAWLLRIWSRKAA